MFDINQYKLNKNTRNFFLVYSLLMFVAGFFLASFDITVHARFFKLEDYGYKYLAATYIISGLGGALVAYVYSILYKKMRLKVFTFLLVSVIVLLCAAYFIFILFFDFPWADLYGMICFFPVNILLMLGLWRFGRKLIEPGLTRVLFPKLRFANFFGLALGGSFFTIGLFFWDFKALEIIAFCFLLILWPMHLFLIAVFNRIKIIHHKSEAFLPVKQNFRLFFTSKYTTWLILFSSLSAMTGYAIHFMLFNTAWIDFKNIVGFSKFYGLLILATITFTYGFDKYLKKRILYSYDSPFSLALIPPVVLLSLGVTLLIKFLAGNFLAREHFSMFFLMVAMLKVGYVSAYMSIQMPALRTLFHSLDIRYRQVAYPRVEGTAILTGLALSGMVILGMTFLKFYSLTFVLIFAIVVSVVWTITGYKLVKLYRKELEKSVGKLRYQHQASESQKNFEENLWSIISQNEPQKIIFALSLARKFHPLEYENDLVRLLSHPSEEVQKYALEQIKTEGITAAIPVLQAKISESTNLIYSSTLTTLQDIESQTKISEEKARELIDSGTTDERINAIYVLANSEISGKEGLLASLTRDANEEIRQKAIRALAKTGSDKFSYTLLDFIYPRQFNPYAFEAIAKSKDQAIDILEREAMLPGIENLVLARIIRLYGKIGTRPAIELLLSKLDSIDSYVMNQSLQALIDIKFQATSKDKYQIQGHIVKIAGNISFLLNVYKTLSSKPGYRILSDAYLAEAEANLNRLFRLLSVIYNPNLIGSFHQIFIKGSRAEISHAVEMADMYIDSDVKPIIFSLVEDIALEEKIKRLDYFFPQAKLTIPEIISATLTYDYNSISLFPRLCAIVLIDVYNHTGFNDELLFCSSHPDSILSETANYVLSKKAISNKLSSEKLRIQYVNTNPVLPDEYHSLLVSRLIHIKKHQAVSRLNEQVIFALAKTSAEFNISKDERLSIDSIAGEYSLLLSPDELFLPDLKQNFDCSKQFISIAYIQSLGIKSLHLKSDGIVWAFRTDTIDELIYDNVDLAVLILNSLETFKLTVKK